MKKYEVNCWVHISVPLIVEANNENEAEEKAQCIFDGINLNTCTIGDSGCEIVKVTED